MSDSPLSWLRKVGGGAAEAIVPAAPPPPAVQERPPPAAPIAASPVAPPVLVTSTGEPVPEGYRAWGSDHSDSHFLDVRRLPEAGQEEAGEAFPFAYLLRITYTAGGLGDRITLLFSECAVSLEGINLKAFRRDLLAGKVSFIEEYDASRFPVRPARGAPLILKITVIDPSDMPSAGRRSVRKKVDA